MNSNFKTFKNIMKKRNFKGMNEKFSHLVQDINFLFILTKMIIKLKGKQNFKKMILLLSILIQRQMKNTPLFVLMNN